MIDLYIALYSEGITDDRFLPTIIARTVQRITSQTKAEMVEVHPLYPIPHDAVAQDAENQEGPEGANNILAAAQLASEHQLLVVHRDADALSHNDALAQRFEPGRRLVESTDESVRVCRNLIPIIPKRMTEAWMLADWRKLVQEMGSNITDNALSQELKKRGVNLPGRTHLVEKVIDPKWTLEQIVAVCKGRRRIGLGDLYEPMAQQIQLTILDKLSAYREFESVLKAKLQELRIVQL